MLVEIITKIQQIKPTKVQYFSSVFPKRQKKTASMPWFIFRSATSRGAPVHNDRLLSLLIMTCVCHCTGSCFIIERSRLQNPITLRLVFYSWQLLASLFIVHEYWRNSTSYVQIYHPLQIHVHRVLFNSEPSFDGLFTHFLYPSQTGRWLLISRQLPCIINAYCFVVSTHIDLQSMLRLVAYYATCFSGTVGTRFLA